MHTRMHTDDDCAALADTASGAGISQLGPHGIQQGGERQRRHGPSAPSTTHEAPIMTTSTKPNANANANPAAPNSGGSGGGSGGGGSSSNNNNNNNPNAECWDSIAFIESAFHHGFMRSRLRTGEFVYEENARLTRELDEFCDVDAMHQPKGPILLLGESGVGKSTFLANWLVRRKKMFQNGQSSYPEFVFYHVVGCSRQSLSVSNLLERILREIKEYFELNKEVPDVEERLSWQFPRFLEAASKKGRSILLIDGLQRLRTTDGESILKWVPLAFPPNVRLIFTGTTSSPVTRYMHHVAAALSGASGASSSSSSSGGGGGGGAGAGAGGGGGGGVWGMSSLSSTTMTTASATARDTGIQTIDQIERPRVNAQMIERIKLEANRRNWTLLHVSPLLEEERWRILKQFLQKNQPPPVHPRPASRHQGATSLSTSSSSSPPPPLPKSVPMTMASPPSTAGGSVATTSNGPSLVTRHGLQLFELQQRAIVAVPMTASPHFLKTLLTSLAWALNEGFDAHEVLAQWLVTESQGQLLEAVLRTMETGFLPDAESTADAQQFLRENLVDRLASTTGPSPALGGGNGSAGGAGGIISSSASRRGHGTSASHSPPKRQLTSRASIAIQHNHHEGNSDLSSGTALDDPTRASRQQTTAAAGLLLSFDATPKAHATHDDESQEPGTGEVHNGDDDAQPNTRHPPELARGHSVHETTEVFVRTAPSRERSAIDPETSGGALAVPVGGSGRDPTRHLGGIGPRTLTPTFGSRPIAGGGGGSNDTGATVLVRKTTLGGGGATGRSVTDEPPSYLTGGLYVPPLAELIGRALCLLYVCRHGLLVNELKFILNAVVTEERQATRESQKLHRKSSFSNVRNLDAERPTAFTEDEWRALLRALRPLGVLFVQEVVALPMCKEALRDVIWWRYIGSERAEQGYHQWLIRFFRIHPTTFRRVEELPWHLRRCYQWDALRNVLVHLPMFQLLYTANFKSELFGYWKLLIDGPLPLFSATATATTIAESSSQQTTPPPSSLTYAAPFDVVREYGRSLDEWYRTARPPTKAFTAMLQLATKFMFEFSTYYQGYLPVFNHGPFDLRRLQQDGFTFAEDLPHVHHLLTATGTSAATTGARLALSSTTTTASTSASTSATGTTASPMAMTAAATAAAALATAVEAFATLNQQAAVNVIPKDKESNGNWFYFYQRWIWIQFPWLALGRDVLLRDAVVEAPVTSKTGGGGGGVGTSGVGASMASGLGPTTVGGALVAATESPHSSLDDDGLLLLVEDPLRDGGHHAGGSGGGGALNGVGGFDARFWDVKRSMFDPVHQRPKGTMSPAKVRGLQNASVLGPSLAAASSSSSSLEPGSLGSGGIHTEDVISPENLFRRKSTFAAVRNVLQSSVRTLPGVAQLPPSASSPALLTTTTVSPEGPPSTTFLTETGALGAAMAEHNGGSPGMLSVETEIGAGAGTVGALTGGALTRELGHADPFASSGKDSGGALTSGFGLPAHFQDYPQSEWDLKRSYNYELVLKLQTLYDQAKNEVKRKQSHLQTVRHKITETQRRYEFTMRECEMAKHAVEEMNLRMDKIEQMIQKIDRQERTHRKLLRCCELFPPSDPTHFETAKKTLRLLQMKVKDLGEEKKVLLVKKHHLQTIELPVLQREVGRNKQLLSAVVERLERAREKLAQDEAATDKLYERRLEMLDNVRTSNLRDGEGALEQEVSSTAQVAASASTRSIAAKVALQQCESMCDKIQKATGYSKLELILEKFVSREELNRGFEEQAKVYEARLKQIKLHHAELEQQLNALEESNAATTTEDPRMLEEKLRVAEVELARTERTQNALLTTSKEVIAGASRVVKLLGITSCRAPHQNALPADQLWPPPVTSDNTLASEFETLEAKEIVNLLQICQERASLMVDVIEGGRSDPDANFTTTKDNTSKSRRSRADPGNGRMGGRGKRSSMTGLRKERTGSGSIVGINGDRGGGLLGHHESSGPTECPLAPSMHGVPTTPELDEDEKNLSVMTRETIKAACRSKLTQKKRTKEPNGPLTEFLDGD